MKCRIVVGALLAAGFATAASAQVGKINTPNGIAANTNAAAGPARTRAAPQGPAQPTAPPGYVLRNGNLYAAPPVQQTPNAAQRVR